MGTSEGIDDAGFSSFFTDYKVPNLVSAAYAFNPEIVINRQTFSTPPDTSISSNSASPSSSKTTLRLTKAQATRTLVLKRKIFDNNQAELNAAIAAITVEDRIDLIEIEKFAAYFKKMRTKYGCTQNDVGLAMGKKYGTEFSQTTISRFEALNLSFKNMAKLRPLLREWLAEVENALAQGISINDFLQRRSVSPPPMPDCGKSKKGVVTLSNDARRRKRRTFIDEYQSSKLTEEYERNEHPSSNYLNELAESLKLKKEVIRIWFSNHRQKKRKIEDERLALMLHENEEKMEEGGEYRHPS